MRSTLNLITYGVILSVNCLGKVINPISSFIKCKTGNWVWLSERFWKKWWRIFCYLQRISSCLKINKDFQVAVWLQSEQI